MIVKWEERRWPRIVHLVLRLIRSPAADQGALRIQTDAPEALGRMLLEDPEGNKLYALIDCSKSRKKWFYLPISALTGGFVLKNDGGDTLFSLAAGKQKNAGTMGIPQADGPPREADRPAQPDEGQALPPLQSETASGDQAHADNQAANQENSDQKAEQKNEEEEA